MWLDHFISFLLHFAALLRFLICTSGIERFSKGRIRKTERTKETTKSNGPPLIGVKTFIFGFENLSRFSVHFNEDLSRSQIQMDKDKK